MRQGLAKASRSNGKTGSRLCAVLASVFCACSVFHARGETYVWTGGGAAGNWNDPQNWDRASGVPGAGDRAEFNAAGAFAISSGIALGEGTLTIKLGSGVTNTISGAISGAGGIRVEGSCTTSESCPSATTILNDTGSWSSVLKLSGDNSYNGGTFVTNAALRGASTSAFGAVDSTVLFSGYTAILLNADGTWRSYRYTIGTTKGSNNRITPIWFGNDMTWYGQLVNEKATDEKTLFFLGCLKKTVDFRSPINNSTLTIHMAAAGHNKAANQGVFNFHEPVCIKRFGTSGSISGGGGFSNFYATGNTYESTQLGYTFNARCMAERILDPARVLSWGGSYNEKTTGWFDMNGYDQQAKGLSSSFSGNYDKYNEIGCYVASCNGNPATLYLLGATQDCLFRGLVTNEVSIVWDPAGPYTQIFSNRVHRMTGKFVVSNGTIRITGAATFKNVPEIIVAKNAAFECSSTNRDCLVGLKRLVIEDGATFTVGANTPKPFADGEIDLVVMGSGRIVMPDGMSVTMKTVFANDIYPTGGVTYNSVSSGGWIGGGEVEVLNAGITSWKTAVSGRWDDASKWTGGVPDGAGKVCIKASGGDYTVTFDGNATLGTALEIGNDGEGTATLSIQAVAGMTNGYVNVSDGGSIEVASTGSFLYEGKGEGTRTASASTEVIAVKGGELRVNGGTVDFAEMSGRIVVAGGESGDGRIVMTDGSIRHLPDTSDDLFRVGNGGLIEMAGGKFCFDYAGTADTTASFRLAGGEVCVTGGVFGVIHTNGVFGGVQMGVLRTNCANLRFHSGKVLFGGDSVLQLNNYRRYEKKCYFSPNSSGGSLDVRIEGQAKTSPTDFRTLQMGSLADNVTVNMDWATAGMDDASVLTFRSNIGFDRGGSFVFNLTNAVYNTEAIGFLIASGSSGGILPACPVQGTANVYKDGELVIDGFAATTSGYSVWMFSGLSVGYSGCTKVTSGTSMYQGALNVYEGGLVRVLHGDFGVGIGFATGNVVIDGGTLNFNDHEKISGKSYNYIDRTCGIGIFGGHGTVEARNGAVFSSRPDVFVGGTITNRFPMQGGNFLNYSNGQKMPSDHSATGTLVVADADVTLKRNLILGMDGFGVVRREGSQGTFTAGNLVCTNLEDAAYTGSRLDFVLDGNGIGAITVTNAVSIFGNASVSIDMSGYTGRRSTLKLIGCKSHTGDFDSVAITGARAGAAPRTEWTSSGFFLRMASGTMLILR